jgi:hypothetical protein
MEYMYLGWYVIVCGRNGESYDSSSFGVFKHFSYLLSIALCQRNPDIKEPQILE